MALLKRFLINFLENTCSRWLFFRRVTKIGYFGLNKIDQHLEEYFPNKNGYFIELGANDGLSQSNTLFLERYKNYKGVLIEPHPGNFEKCRNNRSEKNYFFMGACVSFNYGQSTMDLIYSNLMTVSLNGDTTIDDPGKHAREGKKFLRDETVYQFSAETKTLTDVLKQANAPAHIDLFSLDVEGSEIEVLKGVDFSKYRFKIICVETNNFNLIKKFLKSRNYNFLKKISGHDYIFTYGLSDDEKR